MRHQAPARRGPLHRVLHHPLTDLAVAALIVLSVVLLVAEAAAPPGTATRRALRLVGDAITALFVVELSLRWWVAPVKRHFFRRYWLDLLSVLPLARPMRLLRVLVVLRLFRAGILLQRRVALLRYALRGGLRDLAWIGTATAMVVLLGAISIHLGLGGIRLDQPGLAGSLWYSVLTLVAGEPTGGAPVDGRGRAVTLALMLGGMTVFGMAVGTVSATMALAMGRRLEGNDMELEELSGHVVICGWNRAGAVLLRELLKLHPHQFFVVVSEPEEPPEDLPTEGRERVIHLSGDHCRKEVLQQAGIERASKAFVLTDARVERSDADRDARTVLTALTIEHMAPGIFCVAELVDKRNESHLRMAGVEEIVVGDWYAGAILASVGRTGGLVGVLNDILVSSHDNAFFKVELPPARAGATVGELHRELLEAHGAILVSVEPAGGATLVNPPADHRVAAGDRLVVIARSRPVL